MRAPNPLRLLEGRYPLNDRPGGLPGLGAVLPAVDLTEEFTQEEIDVIQQASHDAGGIVVFPDQTKLTPAHHVAFARQLGEIEPHAVAAGIDGYPEVLEIVREADAKVVFGEDWHSDNSFMQQTCSFSILRGTGVMPRRGSNDTLFSSTEAAYAALSPHMQNFLGTLTAYHSANKAYGAGSAGNSFAAMQNTAHGQNAMRMRVEAPILDTDYAHPVVTVHPDTGRRSLFVSPTFTKHIHGMSAEESTALLSFIYSWIAKPQFSQRVSWSKHQVTMWDNRSLSHKGIADILDERRIVHRVSIRGHAPFGVEGWQRCA